MAQMRRARSNLCEIMGCKRCASRATPWPCSAILVRSRARALCVCLCYSRLLYARTHAHRLAGAAVNNMNVPVEHNRIARPVQESERRVLQNIVYYIYYKTIYYSTHTRCTNIEECVCVRRMLLIITNTINGASGEFAPLLSLHLLAININTLNL